jgi:hypothetical protein
MSARVSSGDGEELAADTVQELVLPNALERSFLFLLIESSASIWALAAGLDALWPLAVGRNLRKGEVAVHGSEGWFEDAVGEEEFDVELARNHACCTTLHECASFLEQLLEGVGGLDGRSAMLVATKVKSANLQVASELHVVV